MLKKNYEPPELEVTLFDVDVNCTKFDIMDASGEGEVIERFYDEEEDE